MAELRARRATVDDALILFEWTNDPLTRRMSFNSDPISLETHLEWLNEVLRSPETHLLIVEKADGDGWSPIAQVRIDLEGELSVSIAPAYRGHGLSTSVLETAVQSCLPYLTTDRLVANIKHDNYASSRAFEKAGFKLVGEVTVRGQACLSYELDLNRRA
jgi:RimJ/RimL family protein N-acetyltransferase